VEIFADLETKKQRANDLTRQLNELVAQQMSYGKPTSSADIDSLKSQVQRAGGELHEAQVRVNDILAPKREKAVSERTAAQARVEQYLRQQLGTGKLIARGIPNDAPPHDNEQIIIKPAQWQYLRLSISTADATDNKGTVFKGVEIGKSKKRPDYHKRGLCGQRRESRLNVAPAPTLQRREFSRTLLTRHFYAAEWRATRFIRRSGTNRGRVASSALRADRRDDKAVLRARSRPFRRRLGVPLQMPRLFRLRTER
jgi:hypothetical protein